jgi:DNA-binding Lrp family transcriptional regulator
MYEQFDATTAKVVLAASPGDSVRRVSQKIDEPYETVRQKVKRLEEAGIVETDEGIRVTAPSVKDSIYQSAAAGARVSPPSVQEAYILPHFADRPFAFTRIDAVYVWTHGGYQVARSADDYVIFVAVEEPAYWKNFFADFGMPANDERKSINEIEAAVQFVVEERDKVEPEWIEGQPVISLDETVEYMRDNFAQFQPALEMLDEMYDKLDFDVSYSEKKEEV